MWRGAYEGFSPHACDTYHGLLENRAALLVSHVIHDPSKWSAHLNRLPASIILGVVYGWPAINKSSDPVIQRINHFAAQLTSSMLPGAHYVEYFPWMLYMPSWMAKWKRDGQQGFKFGDEMFMEFLEGVEVQWVRPRRSVSFRSS